MGDFERDGPELSGCQQYRTLLAVSEAIVSHRDLATLFHELAGRLHLVVRFDYLACVLHEATSNTMRLHILETTEPIPAQAPRSFSVEEDPAGSVWQAQHPLIVSNVAQESRWPQFPQRAKPFGVNGLC
jgi:formate hydrogenlyase transcriptional activator